MISLAMRAKAASYICHACAERAGGRWPDGHRASFHGGICGLCKRRRSIASWDDWDWPFSSLNKVAQKTRET